MKTIPTTQLKPGMFVQKVIKQTGNIRIKNQGWVKTQSGIDKLIKSGILEVEIDPNKMLTSEESETQPTPATKHEIKQRDPWLITHSAEQEMSKAKKLYDEAKNLQTKAFGDIESGRTVDVAPFRELASGFIDSVFRNQDALACITQMRQKDAYLLEHSINVSILMSIFAKHLNI